MAVAMAVAMAVGRALPVPERTAERQMFTAHLPGRQPWRPSVAGMTLVRVGISDTPATILGYMAVEAAVRAAVGLPLPAAAASHPTWEDGEGSWLTMVLPGDGRALLAGWHREESEIEGSGTGTDGGTDLIDTAPGWWRRGIEHARSRGDALGFLYGWDGTCWWRAPYDAADGFDPDFFPVTRTAVCQAVDEMAADTLLDDPLPATVDALLDAGPQLDAESLRAALGTSDGWPEVDYRAGETVAKSFAGLL